MLCLLDHKKMPPVLGYTDGGPDLITAGADMNQYRLFIPPEPIVGDHGMPRAAIKVLFLDLDGVLNSDCWYDRLLRYHRPIPHPPFDREAVARLDRIIRATGAWIVLSTSWRSGYPELPGWLVSHGCGGIVVGITPSFPYGPRGREIASWLNQQARRGVAISRFCILDDTADMDLLEPWLVQTDPQYGLQDDDVDRAIALLGGGA